MSTVGERLREERDRLGMSQTAFAEAGGVQKRAQINYEKDERSPDARYLIALFGLNVDVMYVLTSQRSNGASTHHLPPDEQLLLESYRGMAAKARKELLAEMLTGGSKKKPKMAGGVSVSGNNNRTAGGTYHENKE